MSDGVDVLVIGPGAMGCLHAARLATAGFRVGLLDHDADRAARLSERGITAEMAEGTSTVQVRCSADAAEFAPAHLAMLFVKAYDTGDAVTHALPALGEKATVLTLQNGLGNCERISEIVAPARVLAGATTTGATLLGEGHVREAGRGLVQIGSPTGNQRRLRDAAGLLERGGISCEPVASVDEALWAKAIVNAAINPLTALTGLPNGQLVEVPELRAMLRAVTREATAIARRLGIFVNEGIVSIVEAICVQTAENRSSMLQDIAAGRRTEIDYINGEIARRAEERGLEAPLCRMLTALVRGLEKANQT